MVQLIGTDFLTDACSLSRGLAVLALLIGLVWWLFGWATHRFWVVLGATVLAGIFGLAQGANLGTPPLLAAVLMAVAAGLLALSLVRAVGFLAAGLTLLLVVQESCPSLNQPVLAFLVGGLLGLSLFRFSLMALTSLGGTILVVFGVLMLLHAAHVTDAPAWADRSTGLVNGICLGMTTFGFLFQFFFNRYLDLRKKANGDNRGWRAFLAAFRWPWRTQPV